MTENRERTKKALDEDWPVTWGTHERDQGLRIARETTPAQRLAWLEAALELACEAGALKLDAPPARDRGVPPNLLR